MMVPAGVITTDTNNVYLRVNGLFDSPQAVRDMPIRINNQTLRLGDMADVTMTYQDPSDPQFYYKGKPAMASPSPWMQGLIISNLAKPSTKNSRNYRKRFLPVSNSIKYRINRISLKNLSAILSILI